MSANLNLIPFGWDEATQSFKDVFDVQRGRRCDCICPSCGTPLIARQGAIKDWHFAHASRTVYDKTQKRCEYSFYVSIRMMARQLIQDQLILGLAECSDTLEHYSMIGKVYRQHFVVAEPQTIVLDAVEVESSFNDVNVDVVGQIKGYPFTLCFTHPGREIPSGLRQLAGEKCGVIAVSLEGIGSLFIENMSEGKTYGGLLAAFLSDPASGDKKWIYHPNYNALKDQAEVRLQQLIEQDKTRPQAHRAVRQTAPRRRPTTAIRTRTSLPKATEVHPPVEPRRQARFGCLMCKGIEWQGTVPGRQVCPQCDSHLYVTELKL